MSLVSGTLNFPSLKLLLKQDRPTGGHRGSFEVSRTAPGHRHPAGLDLSGPALSSLSLA